MRPTALLERYRMALEVIASGVEWEPGTKTARMALGHEVTAEEQHYASVSCDEGDHNRCLMPGCECECHSGEPEPRLSVNEAVEQARENEPGTLPEVDDIDDEPEPIDLAEIDEELDAEEAEPEKPQRVREKVGDDGLTDTQRAILELVRERGEVTKTMIVNLIPGATEDKVKRGLRVLRNNGMVSAEGETAGRTYKPVIQRSDAREATEAGQQREAATLRERIDAVVARQDKPTMPEEPASEPVADAGRTDGYTVAGMPAVQAEVKRNGVGSDEGRLLESVRFKPNWSIAQHAGRLDLHQDRVSRAMRKLEDEGEVKSSPHGGRVVWNVR